MASKQSDKPSGKISLQFIAINLPAEFAAWQGRAAVDTDTGELYLPFLWLDAGREFKDEAIKQGEIMFCEDSIDYAPYSYIERRLRDEDLIFIKELAIAFSERFVALGDAA